MRSSHSLDAVAVTFDDERLVADAGLMLPATLAQHLGLRELFDDHVDLGDAVGHANVGHKAMTLIHSALAGGDSIDDADALRAGSTQAVLGHAVLAPSTLGTFLRSFTWGHARQ
ncbi:MAG: IS1380 family transposase, partial [Acidimicrobiales bacterium]